MSMRLLAVAAAALVTAGCGNATEMPPAEEPRRAPVTRPTAVPAAAGPVRGIGTVLDDGDGPELCLGGIATSLPPQCSGPPVEGWDWAMVEHESARGVRWVDSAVEGTFDGTTFVVTTAAQPPEHEWSDDLPWTTECPEPDGGWRVLDEARTTDATMQRTFALASRLPGYDIAFMDQSLNPAFGQEPSGLEWEQQMNDPLLTIVNVRVVEDVVGAETRLREVWGGMLCVQEGTSTQTERLQVQREINKLPGMLESGAGSSPMSLRVVYDDGSIQAWVDQEYGAGFVEVTSALEPVG